MTNSVHNLKSKTKVTLSPLALLLLAACGSGGGGGGSVVSSFTRSGAVVKGPLKDALAFLDYDNDGARDLVANGDAIDEPSVRTNADGTYSVTGAAGFENSPLVAITDGSTVDTSSGTVLDGVTLSAPATATVVSMASTLMVQSEKSGTPLTEAQVKEALGITGAGSESINLLTFNPFEIGSTASAEQKQLAASVEIASQQVSAVVTSMTAAAKASGISETDAFAESLKAVSTFVKEQADASTTVDLTNTTQLTEVANKVSTAVASKASSDPTLGVDTVAFDNMKATVVIAVQNVNTVVEDNIDASNFSSEAAKSVYSVSQVLVDQVSAAVTAEKLTKGTGATSITYSDRATVDTASNNPAPTDIDLIVNGIPLSEGAVVSVSEGTGSLAIATIAVEDRKSDGSVEANFTYALAGDDASSFTIANGVLYLSDQPDFERKSSYNVSISAKDSEGKSFAESFTVKVTDVDEPAENISISKSTLNEEQSGAVVGNISAADPEGQSVTFTVDQTKEDGIFFEVAVINNAPVLKLKDGVTANFESNSSYSITIKADDRGDGLNVAEKTLTLSVTDINDAPIVANAFSDQTIAEDSAYNFQFETTVFNDVDAGDSLTYSANLSDGSALPRWLSFDPATRSFTGTPKNENVGTLDIKVTATDIGSTSVSDIFRLEVTNTNDAPTISLGASSVTITEDVAYSYSFVASDVDVGDNLTIAATTKPSWLILDTTAQTLSGTPTNEAVGDHAVVLTATDQSGSVATQPFTISVTNTNDAPTITSTEVTAVNEDASYSYTMLGSDVDVGDSLTLAATTLPSWLSFDASTGILSGTPTNEAVGDHAVVLTATDQSGSVATQSFSITVNQVPTVENPISDQTATEDSAFSFQFSSDVFADADPNDVLTYSASPSWLTFNAATRTFSGTPTNDNVGTENIIITASDGFASAQDNFSLTVNNTNDAPLITSTPSTSIQEDRTYSYFAFISDEDPGDFISLKALTLPNWLTYNTVFKQISGTPTNADVGNHSVSLTFKDKADVEVRQDFTIVVENVNDAPTVTNPILDQKLTAGQTGSFSLAADTFTDIDVGDSLTLNPTLSSGSDLPAWLTYDQNTRTFTGTPTSSDLDTLQIIVKATDLDGFEVSEQFELDILHAPTALVASSDVQVTKGTQFSYSTSEKFSDPDGASDITSYAATLKGGAALPAWLSINSTNGILSGTAPSVDVRENPRTFNLDAYDSDTGTYSSTGTLNYETTFVTVTATDSAGLSASTEVHINPKGVVRLETDTVSLVDYPGGSSANAVSSTLTGTLDYRENVGTVLSLSSFSLNDANLQLVKDGSTSTWPKSPEILFDINTIDAPSNFGNIGEISIYLGEVKNNDGVNYLTNESGEKYVELRFTADASVSQAGELTFSYVPRLEGDVKYNINSNPLIATAGVNENETLMFSSGNSKGQLKISVLDLLDQLPFASSIGSLLPFAPGDFYVQIDGLPIQSPDGDFIDLIDAQFSIV